MAADAAALKSRIATACEDSFRTLAASHATSGHTLWTVLPWMAWCPVHHTPHTLSACAGTRSPCACACHPHAAGCHPCMLPCTSMHGVPNCCIFYTTNQHFACPGPHASLDTPGERGGAHWAHLPLPYEPVLRHRMLSSVSTICHSDTYSCSIKALAKVKGRGASSRSTSGARLATGACSVPDVARGWQSVVHCDKRLISVS